MIWQEMEGTTLCFLLLYRTDVGNIVEKNRFFHINLI